MTPCPRCRLVIHGTHLTPDDCLRTIVPRHQLAQSQVAHLHKRVRAMEERLERARIQLSEARKQKRRVATWEGRVLAIEQRLGLGV